MTRDEKIIRNKVGVLELAKQLGSVSHACRIMGFSRDSFYRFRDLYEKGGEAALIEMSRRVPNPKNRVAEAAERRILELAVEQPAWGHTRMANELAKEGIRVSPTGVRGVWVRHDLNTMAKRLKALEAKVAQDGLILTEDQLAALEKAKADLVRARRVRQRLSRPLWGAGHLLRRHVEGGGSHLSADLHRHLRQGRLRQALRRQDGDHRRRSAE